MYNPSTGFLNAMMRWPILGGIVAGITAISTDGIVAVAASFVAGSIAGTYGLTKLFNDQICDCEEKGYFKFDGPKIDWIVEYNPESGDKRPWDVYSIFAGLEETKQHFASYATEDNALSRIEELKEKATKIKEQ